MIQSSCKTGRQQIQSFFKNYRFLVKPTIKLSVVYLIGISALLRANIYYADDIARAMEGYARFDAWSRYLATFFSWFLHTDTYLTDISPLPQIIAVFVVALASAISVYLITGNKEPSWWCLIAALPIGLSPYFLECLSFKYDSPYMALSVLFSVLPLLFCNGNQIIYVLCSMLGIIGMCTTYQASSGIFPMLVVLLAIRRWTAGEQIKQVLQFIAVSAAGYLLGIGLFRFVLMSDTFAYASTEAASLAQLFPCILSNYKKYIVHILRDFKPEWLFACFLVCVCFLWAVISQSKQSKLAVLVITGIAMLGMFLLSYGAYAFLVSPIFAARAMYGFGCLIAFLGIFAVANAPKACPAKAVTLVLSWMFFVFSFIYGNAWSVQSKYTDFRITEAIDDLAECRTLWGEDVTLQITGSIGYAPVLENMLDDFPIIEKLILVTFQGDGWWGEYGIRYYYGLPSLNYAETYDPPEKDLPVIADNYYHTIYADDTYIWIELH